MNNIRKGKHKASPKDDFPFPYIDVLPEQGYKKSLFQSSNLPPKQGSQENQSLCPPLRLLFDFFGPTPFLCCAWETSCAFYTCSASLRGAPFLPNQSLGRQAGFGTYNRTKKNFMDSSSSSHSILSIKSKP